MLCSSSSCTDFNVNLTCTFVPRNFERYSSTYRTHLCHFISSKGHILSIPETSFESITWLAVHAYGLKIILVSNSIAFTCLYLQSIVIYRVVVSLPYCPPEFKSLTQLINSYSDCTSKWAYLLSHSFQLHESSAFLIDRLPTCVDYDIYFTHMWHTF